MSRVTDTHSYDGKMGHARDALDAHVLACPKCSNAQARTLARAQLRERLTRQSALRALGLIEHDTQKPNNYDHTNQVYADKVLEVLCIHLNKEVPLDVLEEQLADVVDSGQCPQGRVIRLLQLGLSLAPLAL